MTSAIVSRQLAPASLDIVAHSVANTAAPITVFEGISVFLGPMISIGSSGLVNQTMSGLARIYSRALRPGV